MKIEFVQLAEIDKAAVIELLNHPLVRRHMPLSTDFNETSYDQFIAEKQRLWKEHGYGPWGILVDGKFVGWGGFQWEQGDADLALVLHPNHWGLGKWIVRRMITTAFVDMGFETITILLPPSRTRIKGVLKLHFKPDGEMWIKGEKFLRYRLNKKDLSLKAY